MRGPVVWATLGAVTAAVAVIAVVLWMKPWGQREFTVEEIDARVAAVQQRAEAERREQELKQQKGREAAEQRQREEQQKQEAARLAAADQARRDAEARKAAEAQKKADAERARREAEAQKKAEAERARREADARKKADAQKKAEEEALAAQRRRDEEARKAEEIKRAATAAAAPKAPAPAAPAGADLLAQAEQAAKRGNDTESLSLYRQAANLGNPDAQYRLGEIFATGRGAPQSNFQAYIWFSAAADAGHAAAKSRRDQVITTLQPAEIQQADRVIRERVEARVRR
jgi:colicin import membrane protein